MRRIKLVVGALAVVVAAFVALSGPAMAQQLECRDPNGFGIVCDGQRYVPFDSDYYDYPDYGDDDDYYFPPYAFNGYGYGYDSYYEDPEEYFDYLEDQVEELEELYEDSGYYGYYGW